MDTTSSYSSQPGENNKTKIVIVIIVLIIAAAIGTYMIFRQNEKPKSTKVVVTEKKEELTPTEKPKIDKDSVKIQVLNGTGTPGQAGKAVEALKEAGYNADNIKTGNAEDFDHKVTTITARDGFEEVAKDIKEALEKIFDSVEVESSKLEKDSEFNIVVVTGGKKFEAPSRTVPSASPSPSPIATTTTPTPSPTSSPTPTP